MNDKEYDGPERRKSISPEGAQVLRLRNWFDNWGVIFRRFFRRYK
jgi:hypothetical protein